MLLAHLSDTHFADETDGATSVECALRAIARVQAIDPRPDCMIITGDLTDHGTAAEYESALATLNTVSVPVHVMAGNHDRASVMLDVMAGTSFVRASVDEPDRCYYRVDYPDLRLFCCDSSMTGRHDGELGRTQLAWLDAELGRGSDVPTVLAMHHHPTASGIEAMDRVMLSDAAELADVLLRHSPVARILVGHLHRAMISTLAGSVVVAAPSTFRQVFLDLRRNGLGAFVDEPSAIMLHKIDNAAVVSHVLPVQSGPPGRPIGGRDAR